MNKYYVYVHRRLTDNLPFYVGKGCGDRAWEFGKTQRNSYWHRVNEKHGCRVEIVFENLSEDEAFQCEKDTILEFKYFDFPLTNLTDGGEGSSGLSFSDQQRLNIRNGLKEKRYSEKKMQVKTIKRPSAYGDNNHFSDSSVYDFVRLEDGFTVSCTRHQLSDMFNINKQLLKKLFYTKNPRKSADGWRLRKVANDR